MISKKDITNAAAAANYFTEHGYSTSEKAEYYANEEVKSAWGGKGAALAGLANKASVDKEAFKKALKGRVVDKTGEQAGEERQLGKWGKTENGEKVWKRRAGWDFTFSAPKSVSIAAEVFGHDAARQAHEVALQRAMEFLEREGAYTRVDDERVKTGNLLWAKFEHSLSRELDPQTHTHVVIANMTMHEGMWYSLSNEDLFRLRTTADMLYKAEMARELQGAGYKLEFDGKGGFEIAGISREQIEKFSIRSEQINAYLKEHGIDPKKASHAQRMEATLETRRLKEVPDNSSIMREHWQERAREYGISEPKRDASFAAEFNDRILDRRETVRTAIAHITERESAFGTKELYAEAARFSEGRMGVDDIDKAVRDLERKGELVRREDGKFTTREMIEAEKSMIRAIENGKGAHMAIMTDLEFESTLRRFEDRKTEQFIKAARENLYETTKGGDAGKIAEAQNDLSRAQNGFRLSGEQRAYARMILTETDAIQAGQGLAGTGKTTVLEFVREAAESKGWEVRGFSNGNAQAQKMEADSGIKSTTNARHILNEEQKRRDADLARRAIATYERGTKMADWDKIKAGEKKGTYRIERDAAGRTYVSDKQGNTWATHLYAPGVQRRTLSSFGFAKTRYAVVRAKGLRGLLGGKDVLATGGSIGAEIKTRTRERLNKWMPRSLVGDAVRAAGQNLLKDEWRRVGGIEALSVRMAASKQHQEDLAELRDLAKYPSNAPQKALWIMDEGSQAGQKEMNQVLDARQRAGAKLIVQGDKNQLQSVAAGTAFAKLVEHARTSVLETINRQQTEETRAVVGKLKDAIQETDEKQRLKGFSEAVKSIDKKNVVEIRDNQDAILAGGKAASRDAVKAAALADNELVIHRLAQDYAQAGSRPDLVLTSTNADRVAINKAIREELKQRGELSGGREVQILRQADRTEVELSRTIGYRKGDVVQFTDRYKRLRVESGDIGEVVKTDSRLGTVTLRMESGREVTFRPSEVTRRQVLEKDTIEVAPGDRIMFRKNFSGKAISNSDTATVVSLDKNKLTVQTNAGETKEIDLKHYRQIDHAYAMTSYKSQGQSVPEVWVHHNTAAGRHGEREAYVNLTRMKAKLRFYTQNLSKAAEQSGLKVDKESAILREKAKDMDRTEQAGRGRSSSKDRDFELAF